MSILQIGRFSVGIYQAFLYYIEAWISKASNFIKIPPGIPSYGSVQKLRLARSIKAPK